VPGPSGFLANATGLPRERPPRAGLRHGGELDFARQSFAAISAKAGVRELLPGVPWIPGLRDFREPGIPIERERGEIFV